MSECNMSKIYEPSSDDPILFQMSRRYMNNPHQTQLARRYNPLEGSLSASELESLRRVRRSTGRSRATEIGKRKATTSTVKARYQVDPLPFREPKDMPIHPAQKYLNKRFFRKLDFITCDVVCGLRVTEIPQSTGLVQKLVQFSTGAAGVNYLRSYVPNVVTNTVTNTTEVVFKVVNDLASIGLQSASSFFDGTMGPQTELMTFVYTHPLHIATAGLIALVGAKYVVKELSGKDQDGDCNMFYKQLCKEEGVRVGQGEDARVKYLQSKPPGLDYALWTGFDDVPKTIALQISSSDKNKNDLVIEDRIQNLVRWFNLVPSLNRGFATLFVFYSYAFEGDLIKSQFPDGVPRYACNLQLASVFADIYKRMTDTDKQKMMVTSIIDLLLHAVFMEDHDLRARLEILLQSVSNNGLVTVISVLSAVARDMNKQGNKVIKVFGQYLNTVKGYLEDGVVMAELEAEIERHLASRQLFISDAIAHKKQYAYDTNNVAEKQRIKALHNHQANLANLLLSFAQAKNTKLNALQEKYGRQKTKVQDGPWRLIKDDVEITTSQYDDVLSVLPYMEDVTEPDIAIELITELFLLWSLVNSDKLSYQALVNALSNPLSQEFFDTFSHAILQDGTEGTIKFTPANVNRVNAIIQESPSNVKEQFDNVWS